MRTDIFTQWVDKLLFIGIAAIHTIFYLKWWAGQSAKKHLRINTAF